MKLGKFETDWTVFLFGCQRLCMGKNYPVTWWFYVGPWQLEVICGVKK